MDKSECEFYIKIVLKKIADSKKKLKKMMKKRQKREKDNLIFLNNDDPGDVTQNNDNYIKGTFDHPVYIPDNFHFTNHFLQND